MILIVIFTIFACVLNCNGAESKGGGAAGKGVDAKGGATGPICDYQVSRADPQMDKSEFKADCASCVSKSMVLGKECYLNAYMRVTRCECQDWSFQSCKCERMFSGLAVFGFFVLPFICIVMMQAGKMCLQNKQCPLYSLERRVCTYIYSFIFKFQIKCNGQNENYNCNEKIKDKG